MRRIFKYSSYAFFGLLGLFFIALFLGVGFENTLLGNIGDGLGAASICTAPLILLIMLFSGLAMRFQGNAEEKQKNDFADHFYTDSAELRRILNRLSSKDRAYLEQYLASREIGLSDDGEMISLDDLLTDADDNIQSLFSG